MTLNSEGLEKARCATDGCGRPATQRFEAGGVGSDHCDDCAEKIRAARPALPPVDGLEMKALDLAQRIEREFNQDHLGGAVQTRAKVQLIIAEALSQASSVIAGLRSERITAERDALDAYGKLQAAEARISSLEEENKRLREALGSAYEHIEQLSELLKIIKNHWIDYDHVFSIAVHEADEFLAARQALEDHND